MPRKSRRYHLAQLLGAQRDRCSNVDGVTMRASTLERRGDGRVTERGSRKPALPHPGIRLAAGRARSRSPPDR